MVLLCLAGCAGPMPRVPSEVMPAGDSPFGAAIMARAEVHPGRSGFRLLPASNEAFLARAELIRAAQRSLDLQYYIVHDGLSTQILVQELLKAADRGVRVRLLIDDLNSDGRDYEIGVLAAHPNIQIRLFNPMHLGRSTGLTRNLGRLLDLPQQHRRMHNKLWLADSSVAIVGGRNLGDEYFDAEPSLNFTDIDLLGVGPVARELGQSFDQYWNSALSKPVQDFLWSLPAPRDLAHARKTLDRAIEKASRERHALAAPLLAYRSQPRLQGWLDELIWAPSQSLWDAPSKVLARGEPDPSLLLATQLAPELARVNQELILLSAYFVPAEEGLGYLLSRADAGVDVRLLTNSLEATDVPPVHGGYAPTRRVLLEHGVRLFELRRQPGDPGKAAYSLSGASNSSLHSKAVIFDRSRVFVGSFNFDPRSVLWNTEVGVVVDSEELAGKVRELALQGMAPTLSYEVKLQRLDGEERLVWVTEDHGVRHVLDKEPASLWRRFNAWVSGAVGLERML
ncbi:phospholipase D family protein [Pseudomonas sp. RIT-PI-AD]|uniref:phospholipase D family protein n=1 Tax=Pseudomonas sp. RIT-PI-AD TaxID=3035294 RepID=UPI0021D8F62B|nr:phospholipase D family protein [Pseudomonas sp. RIT-PI-AD]